MEANKKSTYFYGFLMVIVCMLWGAGSPISKIAYITFPPLLMFAIRFSLATIILLILFGRKTFKQLNKNNFKNCIIISVLTAITYLTAQLSIYYTAATIAGFLMGIAIIFTPFLAFLLFRIKIDPRIYPILIIVVVGMYLLCGIDNSYDFGIGEILALISSFTYALWLVFATRYVKDIGVVPLTTLQCGVAAIASIPLALIIESPSMVLTVSPTGWLCLLYLTIFSTLVSYLLQNIAFGHVSAVFAAVVLSLEPVFTAVLSYFMLGELLTFTGYIGGVMIFVGLILASIIEERALDDKLKA